MSAVTFVYPWALLLLLGVPVLVWWWGEQVTTRLQFSRTDALLNGPRSLRVRLRAAPLLLRGLAVTVAIVGCARPQQESPGNRAIEGIDLFLALDMSGSMSAVDLPRDRIQAWQQQTSTEPPNRFEIAIQTLQRVVAGRSRDRIGMVVFARDAYLQFPLTLDYATIQALLASLQLEMIDPSATAIGNALGISVRGLLESEAKSRAIILITDGKQQGGNISPVEAARLASEEGIRIYTILVGSEGTAMAPTGRVIRGLGRDYQPQAYAVDPALLVQISEMTQGRSYQALDQVALERDFNAILDELETTAMEDVANVRRDDLTPRLLWWVLALLIAEALMANLWIRRFP